MTNNKKAVDELFVVLENAISELNSAKRDIEVAMDDMPNIVDAVELKWPAGLYLRDIIRDLQKAYGRPMNEYETNMNIKLGRLINVLAVANIDTVEQLTEYIER
tara:strand:- start:8777 stop:9088 length:312 start_codon:yes stop_codon:yes gene_type:complete